MAYHTMHVLNTKGLKTENVNVNWLLVLAERNVALCIVCRLTHTALKYVIPLYLKMSLR